MKELEKISRQSVFYGNTDLCLMPKVLYLAGLERDGNPRLAKSIIEYPGLIGNMRSRFRFGDDGLVHMDKLSISDPVKDTFELWAKEKNYHSLIPSYLYDYALKRSYWDAWDSPDFITPLCDIFHQNNLLISLLSEGRKNGHLLYRMNLDLFKSILNSHNAVDYDYMPNSQDIKEKKGLFSLFDFRWSPSIYTRRPPYQPYQDEAQLEFMVDFVMSHASKFLGAKNKDDSVGWISMLLYDGINNGKSIDLLTSHKFDSMLEPTFMEFFYLLDRCNVDEDFLKKAGEKWAKIDWESNSDNTRKGFTLNKHQFELLVNSFNGIKVHKALDIHISGSKWEYTIIKKHGFKLMKAIFLANEHQVASNGLVILENYLDFLIQSADKEFDYVDKSMFIDDLKALVKELVKNPTFKKALKQDDRGSKLLKQANVLINPYKWFKWFN